MHLYITEPSYHGLNHVLLPGWCLVIPQQNPNFSLNRYMQTDFKRNSLKIDIFNQWIVLLSKMWNVGPMRNVEDLLKAKSVAVKCPWYWSLDEITAQEGGCLLARELILNEWLRFQAGIILSSEIVCHHVQYNHGQMTSLISLVQNQIW